MHQVLELTDVAGPRVIAQAVLRRDAKTPERQALVVDEPIDVVTQQFRHVLRVVAQRRNAQRQHVEVREQVEAERLGAARLEAGRRRRQDAHVEAAWRACHRAAHEELALERRKQQALRARGQVLEPVDEQHAAVGFFEHAGLDRPSASEPKNISSAISSVTEPATTATNGPLSRAGSSA